jgi:Protein of unknown function (DUF3040)
MGLSARERQALRSIEGSLAVSAPGLTSRLAVFSRLAVGEAFPARESIRTRRFGGRFRWLLAWPVLWLLVSFALIAAGLTAAHGGGRGETCTVRVPSCAWHVAATYPPW